MNLTLVWPLLFILISSGCARVKIKNQEWCGDKGPLGAKCWNTLNDNERVIPAAVWNKIEVGPDHRFGKVCTDIENFTDTKAVILNLCKASKRCTYDMKTKVITFVDKVQQFAKLSKQNKLYIENNDYLFQDSNSCLTDEGNNDTI